MVSLFDVTNRIFVNFVILSYNYRVTVRQKETKSFRLEIEIITKTITYISYQFATMLLL